MDFQDYQETHSLRWQRQLIRIFLMLSIVTFIAETAICVMFVATDTLSYPLWQYLVKRLVVPSSFNFAWVIIAWYRFKNPMLSWERKEGVVLTMAVMICGCVSIFHNYYRIFLSSLALPFLLCSIFANERQLRRMLRISIPLLLISFVTMWIDNTTKSRIEIITGIVPACIFVFSAYFFSVKLVQAQQEHLDMIVSSHQRQNELIHELKIEPLTHLYNRTAMHDTLDNMFSRAKTGEITPVAVVIDLDFFKNVNDTHGHIAGDKVLVALADTIKATLGSIRNAFRFGGEEFVLLFEDKTEDEVYEKTGEILKKFSSLTFDFAPESHVTFSAGICTYRFGFSKAEWFENADSTMYSAKSLGRNRIERYTGKHDAKS